MLAVMCAFVSKFITYYTQYTAMDCAGCFTVSLTGYDSVVNALLETTDICSCVGVLCPLGW